MAIKPILFNTEMVKAILEGRKTQTRRIAFSRNDLREFDHPPYTHLFRGRAYKSFDDFLKDRQTPKCKYRPGDILWVRETFDNVALGHPWYYKADGDLRPECRKGERWMPSIHMPKEAARIFLRVENVRLQRLQTISSLEIRDEGINPHGTSFNDMLNNLSREWRNLWNSTVQKSDLPIFGWESDPWVWVIEFERCEKPEGWCST